MVKPAMSKYLDSSDKPAHAVHTLPSESYKAPVYVHMNESVQRLAFCWLHGAIALDTYRIAGPGMTGVHHVGGYDTDMWHLSFILEIVRVRIGEIDSNECRSGFAKGALLEL
jgi:hypothetical protein